MTTSPTRTNMYLAHVPLPELHDLLHLRDDIVITAVREPPASYFFGGMLELRLSGPPLPEVNHGEYIDCGPIHPEYRKPLSAQAGPHRKALQRAERLVADWTKHVQDKNHLGRNELERLCCLALEQFNELRNLLQNTSDLP